MAANINLRDFAIVQSELRLLRPSRIHAITHGADDAQIRSMGLVAAADHARQQTWSAAADQ
jgi:hypothetical protein